jgi:competence protein ComEC
MAVPVWTSRIRLLGVVPFATGAFAAALTPKPDLLITGDGRHLAILSSDGTPLMFRDRSGDFMRDLVSEASGFDDEPRLLSSASFSSCSRDACVVQIQRADREYRVLATRTATRIDWQSLVGACAAVDIAVSDRWLPRSCKPRWLKLDRNAVESTGGIAVYVGDKPRVGTVAEQLDAHPWAM